MAAELTNDQHSLARAAVALGWAHGRDLPSVRNQMVQELDWDSGAVTVTDEGDGTFTVRLDGKKIGRWPSQEIAEKRAANIRNHQTQHGKDAQQAAPDA